VTATCPFIRAHWRLNLCILRPTRVHNRNGKWTGSAVFAQLTTESVYTSQLATLSTRIAPSHGGSGCFRPMRAHNPNGTSIGSVIFAQMTAECLYSLQWFACFPLKTAPSHVGIWTSCSTWFIGPTRVRNANSNLIVSVVLAGLTSVTQ